MAQSAAVIQYTDYRQSDMHCHIRELSDLSARLTEIERAPLSDRREAYIQFAQTARDNPRIIADRVGWLLNGSYGYGAYWRAWQIATSSNRNNKPAQLCQLIAAVEWGCTAADCRKAYKALSPAQQVTLTDAIIAEMNEMIAENTEPQTAPEAITQ